MANYYSSPTLAFVVEFVDTLGLNPKGYLNCEGSNPSESTSKLKLNSSVHSIDPNSNFYHPLEKN